MTDNVAGVNEDLKAEARRLSLGDRLADWTPVDEASWHLGQTIGLWPAFTEYATFRDKVGGWWTRSPTGDALYECLEALARGSLLLKRFEGTDYEYRWVGK
jgi:hypothetical protein